MNSTLKAPLIKGADFLDDTLDSIDSRRVGWIAEYVEQVAISIERGAVPITPGLIDYIEYMLPAMLFAARLVDDELHFLEREERARVDALLESRVARILEKWALEDARILEKQALQRARGAK